MFQQIKGTAMGAAFSPTAANIFLSVTIRFLRTQNKKPLLLVHYIDNIFMIWTHTEDEFDELKEFLTDLNSHNYAISYTYHHSLSTVDFLDLTIYKIQGLPSPIFLILKISKASQFIPVSSLHLEPPKISAQSNHIRKTNQIRQNKHVRGQL